MVEQEPKLSNQISGTAVEEAVVGFFEGIDLTKEGKFHKGNKEIKIFREKKSKIRSVLNAVVTVNGIDRAIIHYYNDSLYPQENAYFMLLGEEVNGESEEVAYNRGSLGYKHVLFARGPGNDFLNKRVIVEENEQLEAAQRLGIKLNVPNRSSWNLK